MNQYPARRHCIPWCSICKISNSLLFNSQNFPLYAWADGHWTSDWGWITILLTGIAFLDIQFAKLSLISGCALTSYWGWITILLTGKALLDVQFAKLSLVSGCALTSDCRFVRRIEAGRTIATWSRNGGARSQGWRGKQKTSRWRIVHEVFS